MFCGYQAQHTRTRTCTLPEHTGVYIHIYINVHAYTSHTVDLLILKHHQIHVPAKQFSTATRSYPFSQVYAHKKKSHTVSV